MSQQLQITGGAKVRSLEGVITGSTGVLGSLPINGANGIPQLDSNGKILVSQLPNSVMEYKGTWNVTTNTPYLVNGTGNTGDVYLVEGAATGGTSHDFGAGAITFYNGDQVIYSGSIWQRGAGSSGTVTSVAITESGDALTITGSPITNSGTINIGFAGTSAQYVAGNGTLVTFPTITTEAQRLITEVYNETGATLTKGTVVYINGGHGNLPTIAKALATSDATSAQTYGVVQSDIGNNNNGFVVVIGSLTDLDTQAYANGTQLYLSSTTAGAWTSTKQYAPAHLVYVGIVTRSHPTQGVVEIKIQNGYELDELHNVSAQSPSNNDGLFYNSLNALWEARSLNSVIGYTPVSSTGTTNYIPKFTTSTNIGNSLIYDNGTNIGIGTASPTAKLSVAGTTAISGQLTLGDTITNGTYTYTLPSATGTLALTSDIPSVTNFVTLNTLQTIIGTKIYSSLQYFDNNVYIKHSISGSSSGYTTLGASASGLNINLASGTSNNSLLFASTSSSNTYTFPNATGTIALTSDLSGYISGSGSSGRIPYFNGTSSITSSANLAWDNTGNFISTSGVYVYNTTTNAYMLTSNGDNIGSVFNVSATRWGLGYGTSSTTLATAALSWDSTGKVSIGNTNSTYNLDVTGTGRFTGNTYVGGNFGVNTTAPIYNDIVMPYAKTATSTVASFFIRSNEVAASSPFGLRFQIVGGATNSVRYAALQTTEYNSADAGSIVLQAGGGNVGIGTSSPQDLLQVNGFTGSGTITIGGSTTGYGSIYFGDGTGSARYRGYVEYAHSSDALYFGAAGSERMRINSNGYVGIGSVGAYLLDVRGNISGDWCFNLQNSNSASVVYGMIHQFNGGSAMNNASSYYYYAGDSAAQRCSIRGNGGIYNFQANDSNLSDIRTKKDIYLLESYWDKFKAIEIVKFKYKDQQHDDFNIGVIAQQVEEVAPEFVDTDYWDNPTSKDKTEMKSIFTTDLYHATIKVLQEAMAKIEELEARLNTLESK